MYFRPRIPWDAQPPINGLIACENNIAEVDNPTRVLEVPSHYWGAEKCTAAAFRPEAPLTGCTNLWSILMTFGMVHLKNVKVLPNAFFGIKGGYRLSSFTLTSQFRTPTAIAWLQMVHPNYAQKSPSAQTFPGYNHLMTTMEWNSLVLMPIWEAYLMQNYMSHMSTMVVCCLQDQSKDITGGACAWCRNHAQVCPCEALQQMWMHSNTLSQADDTGKLLEAIHGPRSIDIVYPTKGSTITYH